MKRNILFVLLALLLTSTLVACNKGGLIDDLTSKNIDGKYELH